MATKFTVEKNYNISILAEGLNVNTAEVEFCLLLEDFKLSLPLKNIKENVFRLRIPGKIKDTLKGKKEINYTINVKDDNLVFEVAKSKFTLELFAVKEVKITEAIDEEEAEDIVVGTAAITVEAVDDDVEETKGPIEPIIESASPSKGSQAKQLIQNIVNRNSKR